MIKEVPEAEKQLPPYEDGKVLDFNARKGYGLIKSVSGKVLFVHYRDILTKNNFEFKRLYSGQEVRFRVGKTSRGEFAYNVFPTRPWFIYGV